MVCVEYEIGMSGERRKCMLDDKKSTINTFIFLLNKSLKCLLNRHTKKFPLVAHQLIQKGILYLMELVLSCSQAGKKEGPTKRLLTPLLPSELPSLYPFFLSSDYTLRKRDQAKN